MAGSWLCLVSILCCSRWSRSDCGGSGPPRGAQGNALWEEGTGLPFSWSGLCPPWKIRGNVWVNLNTPNIQSVDILAPFPHLKKLFWVTNQYLLGLFRRTSENPNTSTSPFFFLCQHSTMLPSSILKVNDTDLTYNWILCVKAFSMLQLQKTMKL